MRLLFIRHGDPDYEKDSLTEKGWREAELLADKMQNENVSEFFVSPLGRARDTAGVTLKKIERKAKTYHWLREFHAPVKNPETNERCGTWDLLPSFLDRYPELLDKNEWYKSPIMKSGNVIGEYKHVTKEFDKLLKEHGYERNGTFYKVNRESDETLAFFCHFGVECVLLSHLMNVSPVCLWQGMCAAPTSVTTVYTEEREQGIASFRCSSFGDISHLYSGGEPPAFAARFCEKYSNSDERH